MENQIYIIIVLIFINLLIQLSFVLRYFYPYALNFLLNEKKTWNPNHDRLFSIGLIFLLGFNLYLSRSILHTAQNIYYSVVIFIILVFLTVSTYLLYRKSILIKLEVENKASKSEKRDLDYDFRISYNKTELENIFNGLNDHNFIELIDSSQDMLDKDLFIETLQKGILPNKVIFKLNMDNIQTKYFFDQLKSNSHEFTLEKFMKIFKNNNPKATPSSLSSSKSKATNTPKQFELLDSIFKG